MGAKIYELLSQRDDLEFLIIDPDKRRDVEERKKFLNAADLVLLCLPEDTAEPQHPDSGHLPRPPHRAGLGVRLR